MVSLLSLTVVYQNPVMKLSKNMEMGTFHGVVEYRLVQKMGWLGWRTTTSTIHDTKLMTIELSPLINTLRKSVRQVWMKGDYIVMSRSLHTEVPSRCVML